MCCLLLQCENSNIFKKPKNLLGRKQKVTSYDSENDYQSKPLSRKAHALFVDRLLLQVLPDNENYTLLVKISQSVK